MLSPYCSCVKSSPPSSNAPSSRSAARSLEQKALVCLSRSQKNQSSPSISRSLTNRCRDMMCGSPKGLQNRARSEIYQEEQNMQAREEQSRVKQESQSHTRRQRVTLSGHMCGRDCDTAYGPGQTALPTRLSLSLSSTMSFLSAARRSLMQASPSRVKEHLLWRLLRLI
jgi:hypothetical protein